jgi:hypothetical protein
MTKDINAQLGATSAFRILESANREESGEVHMLIAAEFLELKSDKVEIEDFLKSLDKDAVIEAAVEEFRSQFTELLNDSIESYSEEE